MSIQVTARPVSGKECDGCRWQVRKGQRKPDNVAPAEYACDNCNRPVCAPHLQHEEHGDWWLCARCLTVFVRTATRRRA